jgi:hypothetical protein
MRGQGGALDLSQGDVEYGTLLVSLALIRGDRLRVDGFWRFLQ